MLEVLRSPRSKAADPQLHVDVGFPSATDDCGDEFMVVDGDILLSYTDFTCYDVPSFFDADGGILPDLEVDPTELLAEFEDHEDGGGNKPQDDVQASIWSQQGHNKEKEDEKLLLLEEDEEGQKKKNMVVGSGDEVVFTAVTTEDSAVVAGSSSDTTKSSLVSAEVQTSKKKKKSKNSNGKRKVDWTPELHRRFVQAVEQLGIDKAVPSRILEIMGIQCLTRHNIASHLQKYRSHRKHLMAREAEAASWAQKQQIYAAAAPRTTTTKGMPPAPWVVPNVGFPPPLHVWGHPPTLPVFPRLLAPPPRPWAPVDPAASYRHQQYNGVRKWGPQSVTHGMPCVPPQTMPPPAAAMLPRFRAPPVPGMMMPRPMYRPPPQTLQLPLDAHPSKESIDAAIGDVLVKPWLPLPLGLKPPSLDSVMSELHKQGIPKIPPPATTTGS